MADGIAQILLSELAREALRLASGCKGVLTAIHDDICAPSHNLEELYALLDRLAAYPEAVDEQRLILEKVCPPGQTSLYIIAYYVFNYVIWQQVE